MLGKKLHESRDPRREDSLPSSGPLLPFEDPYDRPGKEELEGLFQQLPRRKTYRRRQVPRRKVLIAFRTSLPGQNAKKTHIPPRQPPPKRFHERWISTTVHFSAIPFCLSLCTFSLSPLWTLSCSNWDRWTMNAFAHLSLTGPTREVGLGNVNLDVNGSEPVNAGFHIER